MQTQRFAFQAMACACEVVVGGQDAATAERSAQAAMAEVRRVETKYSRYLPDSVISSINAAAGGPAVPCDDETWALLDYAQTLYGASQGLFDITSGVLRRAWNFKQPRLPSAGQLAEVRSLIGWPRVERSQQQVRLPQAGMELDFGGFGKEYAADCAGAVLAAQGVAHGYVNLGGDMRVLGPKPDGQPWMIGIQDPRQPGQLLATVPVARGGLATSGDYERYFEIDGRRYCHVLDPHTGLPVTHWRTVSVVAPLAVVAGNCSTIAMLKQAEGLAFLKSSGMVYLAVDHTGALHSSRPPSA